MYKLLTSSNFFTSLAVCIIAFCLTKYFRTCPEGIAQLQAINNISECYVQFKRTNQSCSLSKINQPIYMQ